MVIVPYPFSSVVAGTVGRTEASPVPPDDPTWTGVAITVPDTLGFRREGQGRSLTALPVCCFTNFPATLETTKPMLFVARDLERGHIYHGERVPLEDHPPFVPRGPKLTEAEIRNMFVGEFFNANLVDYVALPDGPARYEIWVEYRDCRSARHTVAIVEEP